MKAKAIQWTLLFLLAFPLCGQAQKVKIIEDEKCGCDIVLVDGIETTREGGLYGFRLEDGTVIVPNKYRFVSQFSNGYCRVMTNYDSMGVIDRTGREIVPCIYSSTELPSDGRVLVSRDGLYGYTDLEGNEVIPPRYIMANSFSEGYAAVMVYRDNEKQYCTLIDTLGNPIVEGYYDNVQGFSSGWAPVSLNQNWGLIDHSGNIVLPIIYEYLISPTDGLFMAGDANGTALFDRRMVPLTDFIYYPAGRIQERRVMVTREGRYGFLDPTGREVIPCIYDEVGIFRMGRTMVRLGNHYGIIDTTGRLVLPIEYEERTMKGFKYMYYDSLALVEKDGRLGFVDLEGKLVIPFYFEEAFQFSEGLAAVRHDGLWGYIDTHGDIFMPFVFDLASPYENGRAEVIYNGEARYVNRKGKCVRNCKGIIAWRDWFE